MTIKSKPKIEKYIGDDYTKVSFKPDLKLFNLKSLSEHTELFKKRLYDMTGITSKNVKIY